MPPQPSVLCFGEILWDFLPAGLFAGGAPFNVAYHLHQQGCDTRIVSAVGNDVLGGELLRRLEDWGIAIDTIGLLDQHPTGYVRASIGPGGDARYVITPDVAWDFVPANEPALAFAAHAAALVFGSLAQRSAHNRDTLARLLDMLPAGALRVFDVNLRPPHDDLDLVCALAKRATMIKLNADEAARLAGDPGRAAGREEEHARVLARDSGCALVCVTAGERGAGLLRAGSWLWEPGRRVEVADTVGAGDSFLATLVDGLIRGTEPYGTILAHACRVGEWVATQRGAIPAYGPSAPISKITPPNKTPTP